MFIFNSYDIKNKLLQAETSVLRHKNDTHSGDRYCIVLYNKNMNYKNSTCCTRSIAIQDHPYINTNYMKVSDNKSVDTLRGELLDILDNTTFHKDRCTVSDSNAGHSKYGKNTGQFLSFGMTASRKSRETRADMGLYTRQSENMNNSKYSKLYTIFCEYINGLHPNIFGSESIYSSCIIAKNSQCQWHIDKFNIGTACLSCVGNYTGGNLLLEHRTDF